MSWDVIKGNWKQAKGSAREMWGDLTDDEIEETRGEREQFIGLVQEKYGKARAEAEAEVREWEAKLKSAA